MARGEMPRHRTPCAHQNAEVVPGADSAQHYTGLGGKWQDQIFLALLLPALPLFLRERHPHSRTELLSQRWEKKG